MDMMMMAASQGPQPGMVPSHATTLGPQQAYLAPVSQYHNVSAASMPQYSSSQFVAAPAPPHYVTSSHHHQAASSQGPPPPPHTFATAPQPYQPAGQPGQQAGQPAPPSQAFVPVSTTYTTDAMGQVVLQMAPGQQPLQLTMTPQPFIQVNKRSSYQFNSAPNGPWLLYQDVQLFWISKQSFNNAIHVLGYLYFSKTSSQVIDIKFDLQLQGIKFDVITILGATSNSFYHPEAFDSRWRQRQWVWWCHADGRIF